MRDFLGGALFLVVGGFALLAGNDLSLGSLDVPGPGWLPLGAAALIVVMAVVLLIRGLASLRAAPTAQTIAHESSPVDLRALGRIGFVVALMSGFIVIMPIVGYLAASTVLMVILMLIASPPEARMRAAAIGLVVALAAYGLFVLALQVPLPQGTLWGA